MTRVHLPLVAILPDDQYEVDGEVVRPPQTYGECHDLHGLCPWARCRFNLMTDVDEDDGSLGLNYGRVMSVVSRREARVVMERPRDVLEREDPGVMLDELVGWWTDEGHLQPTCAVWWAENGGATDVKGLTLEEVGDLLNVTRERVRQIETRAMRRIMDELGADYEPDELAEARHALVVLGDDAWE